MIRMQSIGVIGAGAWGTALALTAARAGRNVTLWGRDANTISEIRARNQNSRYLRGITFDEEFAATTSLPAVAASDVLLLVTPAQTTRALCEALAEIDPGEKPIVLCSKGIERSTGQLVSQVVKEVLPQAKVAVLSGPSFAEDVAKGLPTAVTIASDTLALADDLARALAAPAFRPYASKDLIGVQIGGALKNVLAIACGAVAGRKLGASAQAALTARGFAELTRLGTAMGAQAETLTGLSGLGDLVLTCSSPQSRNFSFGMKLGEGLAASDLIHAGGTLAEGAHSARIAVELGTKLCVELPISQTVAAMIDQDLSIEDALLNLMARPLKAEIENQQ
ncbi:glycerol-3-phosphate dehydrogenase [NAD(P)+] [Roseibium aquae]|uniref:Glycerol-3-phosphate dehydrogenase [NAD(P)+] n=1 Tax=Roseibium aquae TaxID=1323746 RepID=A0A916TAD0_9HYPH|nr:NAD(P)H-dependent glycerol-3-phosphate dehydrogenase [Roseibium aquae]GGB37827.1 glycerol-3-phosphate dehydrogenase [NAD(P)+] [Roseibium aquae]